MKTSFYVLAYFAFATYIACQVAPKTAEVEPLPWPSLNAIRMYMQKDSTYLRDTTFDDANGQWVSTINLHEDLYYYINEKDGSMQISTFMDSTVFWRVITDLRNAKWDGNVYVDTVSSGVVHYSANWTYPQVIPYVDSLGYTSLD